MIFHWMCYTGILLLVIQMTFHWMLMKVCWFHQEWLSNAGQFLTTIQLFSCRNTWLWIYYQIIRYILIKDYTNNKFANSLLNHNFDELLTDNNINKHTYTITVYIIQSNLKLFREKMISNLELTNLWKIKCYGNTAICQNQNIIVLEILQTYSIVHEKLFYKKNRWI